MQAQDRLNFVRRDIFAAAAYPVGFAADEKQVASSIEVTEVASVHPEVAPGLRGLRRVVVIAEHEGERDRRAQHDLADFTGGERVVVRVHDGDFRPAIRMADRARDLCQVATGDCAAAFGVAVDVDDLDAESSGEFDRNRCRDLAVDTGGDAHSVTPVIVTGGLVHQRSHHGSNRVDHRRVGFAHTLPVARGAETPVNGARHVVDQRPNDAELDAAAVEHRQGGVVMVAGLRSDRLAVPQAHDHVRKLWQDDALGKPGRAAAVEDHARHAGIDSDLRQRRIGRQQTIKTFEAVFRAQCGNQRRAIGDSVGRCDENLEH